MGQQHDPVTPSPVARGAVGVFVNPAGQRRSDFQAACGALFGRLYVADGVEHAGWLLAGQPVDLLVIDLERFERGIDLAELGQLVAQRKGAPVLVLCPFVSALWLPALMAYGPLAYAITPLGPHEWCGAVEEQLAGAVAAGDQYAALRQLLEVRSHVQQALAEADEVNRFAEALCERLCSWPGVVHASLFHLKDGADLQLEAQHGSNGLNLATVLQRAGRLLKSPLRHAFPGLLAAAGGEVVLLDVLDKAGEAELAQTLRDHAVGMALGLPIPATGPGAPCGSLCLLFDRTRKFSREQFATLQDLAQLAGYGLRMADMNREAEQLLARLTHIATTDALTGVANRRHGEELLEQEIKRARRYKLPLAVIAFDVDRFKAINDRYGHPVGDVALRTVADTAQSLLRSSDVLVRAGGEEFQVIAPHTSAIDGLKMAEKLRHAIEQAAIPGCDHVTISLGVAQLGEQESGDSLAVRVNAALVRAKRAGRNCVELAMQ
jgi:diguanylate cyclase (GGDEF)-like protein